MADKTPLKRRLGKRRKITPSTIESDPLPDAPSKHLRRKCKKLMPSGAAVNRRKVNKKLNDARSHLFLETDEKTAEAVTMRIQGYTYAEIAVHFGVSAPLIHRWVTRYWAALREATTDLMEDLRIVENTRLDRLERRWQPVIMSEDLVVLERDQNGDEVPVARANVLAVQLKATDALLKIMQRRALMNGLDAPKHIEIEQNNWIGLREAIPDVATARRVLGDIAAGQARQVEGKVVQ
jgi:hypothetical protein